MLTPLLSRFLILLLTISALGCTKKGDEPSPKDILGRWSLKTQNYDYYRTDGSFMETKTDVDTNTGISYYRVFMADNRFEFRWFDDVEAEGTYTYTNKRVVFTFNPNPTSAPPLTLTVTKLTATELVLVADERQPGKVSYVLTQTFIKK